MPKLLPYFRWFPADAETDHNYASLTDEELGFYHRCLNRAWCNGGLPADLDELAAIMRITREDLGRLWAKVGRCFQASEDGSLINRRQEEERAYATAKSARNANAARSRGVRSADVDRAPREREVIAEPVRIAPRASRPRVTDLDGPISQRFEEFWALFPRKQRRDFACHQWLSVVTVEAEAAVFACLERYNASDEVARGVVANPDKWLYEQHRNAWKGDWPKARDSPALHRERSFVADVEQVIGKRIQETGKPW